jgi:hypothetical protein
MTVSKGGESNMKGSYSFSSKEEAVQKAKSLLKFFSNKGWTYRVWFNMGWHIDFQHKEAGPAVQVNWDNINGEFWCLICNSWSLFNSGPSCRSKKDPVRMVKRAIKIAEKELQIILDMFEQSRKAVA